MARSLPLYAGIIGQVNCQFCTMVLQSYLPTYLKEYLKLSLNDVSIIFFDNKISSEYFETQSSSNNYWAFNITIALEYQRCFETKKSSKIGNRNKFKNIEIENIFQNLRNRKSKEK